MGNEAYRKIDECLVAAPGDEFISFTVASMTSVAQARTNISGTVD